MRVCHGFTAGFDDPNLVSCAGLAPVLHLAERAGLQRLIGEHVELGKAGGVNAHLKIPALVAGMVAGADSIDDMALLRHGAMRRLFAGVRAPSTLGTFLRSFTFGHVRQLDAVASRLLVNLAGEAPLLPGADELAYVDADDTLRRTYGYAKQGAGCGYTGVKGLNALLAIVSTPSAALVHRESARIRALKVPYGDDELGVVQQAAARAGLRPSSFVAATALASATGGHVPAVAACDREVLSELLLARLAVLQYGTNVNQIAAALNSTGQETPVWLSTTIAGAERTLARLDEAAG